LLYFYVFNVLQLLVIGHGYRPTCLWHVGIGLARNPAGVRSKLCTIGARAGATVTRCAHIAAVVVMLTAAVILFGLLNVFIYADSVIYQLWRSLQ